MSEILANIVVDQNNINFTPTNNNINITPEAIQLNIYTTGAPAGGLSSNTELLYNNTGIIDGVPFTSYANGKLTLGSTSNISITGGTNGYVLQTDGTGNLTWTAQTGGGGNGSPGGANTQVQFNDAGVFGGLTGFTFDKTNGNLNVPNNVIANNFIGNFTAAYVGNANYANFAGNVVNSTQSNITSLGTLTGLSVSGNTSITSTTTIQQAKEKVTVGVSGLNGTYNYDLLDQAIVYISANASGNFTLNFRGNSAVTLNSVMNNNQSMTCALLNTNGATGYYLSSVQIDGSSQTVKWVSPIGAPITGIINGIDSYNFNIIKTGTSTYTVLASRVGFQ